MQIDKSSCVSIEYLIRLGEREYYPPNGKPEEITFCMGWGVMPPGLEEALLGMTVDEKKVVRLTPEQAYGEIDRELIMEVPRSDFDPELEIRPGLVFETKDEDNHPAYFIVNEVRAEEVVIDFNHPLAGKELEVSFTVRQVREATPEELQGLQTCPECGGESPHQH